MTRIATIAFLFFAPAAFAQDEADGDGRTIKYKERTEIDFEQIDVSGELVKPQGALIGERRRASFNPIIRIRPDFNEEMAASIDEIR